MTSKRTAPLFHVSRIALTALATLGLALALSPARAANPDPAYEPVSQLVQYSDINLNSHQGIARLYQLIDAAARDVCASESSTRALAEWSQARACLKAAVSSAVAQIDNAALTAFYTKKTGRLIDRRALLAKR
ncbi:MAG TPA: UrcA family protein [Steroidobacteraceae bacterium]|jgi:UrcA family protein|nr:UrcA family protein [Steroidobacteraceae bacterium]